MKKCKLDDDRTWGSYDIYDADEVDAFIKDVKELVKSADKLAPYHFGAKTKYLDLRDKILKEIEE